MSINRGLIKMWYIYTMEYLLSHNKEQTCVLYRDVNGTRNYHTDLSKVKREKLVSYIAFMWNLEKMIQINLFAKQK